MENAKKKMSKGKKIGLIAAGVVALLIAIVLIYGFVITKSGYWLLSKFTPDTPEQQMSYSSASDTVRTIAEEGFVLMQNNDNLLPLDPAATKLNLFGIRSVQMVYNGGGSAASDVTKCVKLETALAGPNGNYQLNEDLLNLNYNFYKTGKASIKATSAPDNGSASEFIDKPDNIVLNELPGSVYTDATLYSDGRTVLEHAREFSDVAVVVLGRGGGEGMDMTPSTLQLTAEETALLDSVTGAFDKVVLILNTANVMEVGFIRDYPQIKSVLWVGYPGESGNEALAKILSGAVNPSGRLSDTWLTDNLANPAANNFMELAADGSWAPENYHYTNGPTGSNGLGDDNAPLGYFNQYSEGIYVGYKYFETRAATDPSYDYDADVVYPFGHGLSYTTFDKKIMAMNEENGVLTVRVEVKNTGDAAGKDVIQIYYNPPYTGAIEKSTVNLAAFKKTNEIAPGDTEYYSIEFNVEDMASYDYKVNKSYVLEKGDYEIMLMDDSHTKLDSQVWSLGSDIIYNDEHDGKRSTDLVAATNHFDDALGVDDYLTREWKSDARAFTGPKAEDFTASQDVLDSLYYTTPTDADLGLTSADLPAVGVKLDQTITIADMKTVPYEDAKWDEFISQLTVEEMANLVGDGAWHIQGIDRLGVPRSATPDGSTAIAATTYSGAVMGTNGAGVTYPTPVVVASTWNPEVAGLMGTSVGTEAQVYGFNGWYAPSMNTHRTAFNGRNFEYYSEDGVLAGKIAAEVVKGATDKGVICFIKHFAMNERETNCRERFLVWSNEQAIREVYLKPFEIAIKEGGALGVMSSFNYIGHTWAGGNSALLTDTLRNEWGFKGIVITDAAIHPHMEIRQFLLTGGDLALDVMAAWMGGDNMNKTVLAAASDPASQVSTTLGLQRAAKNILYAVSRTWMVG